MLHFNFNVLHPLTNFKIENYYQKEHEFNGLYLRNNLLKIKNGAYVINLDEYISLGTLLNSFVQ